MAIASLIKFKRKEEYYEVIIDTETFVVSAIVTSASGEKKSYTKGVRKTMMSAMELAKTVINQKKADGTWKIVEENISDVAKDMEKEALASITSDTPTAPVPDEERPLEFFFNLDPKDLVLRAKNELKEIKKKDKKEKRNAA
jgi:hypothetical protein